MNKKSRATTNSAKIDVRAEWGPRHPRTRAERRQCIEFLIYLSGIDPLELANSGPPGDLINLAYNFFRWGILQPDRGFGRTLSRENLTREAVIEALSTSEADMFASQIKADPSILLPVRDVVRELLEAAADPRPALTRLLDGTEVCYDGRCAVGYRLTFFTPPGPRALEQAVRLAASDILNHEGAELIRRCLREECRRIFVASRPNQDYCSRKCVNIAGFERHKAKIGEEAYRVKHAKAMKKSRQIRQRKARA